jgi:hypothetical protein
MVLSTRPEPACTCRSVPSLLATSSTLRAVVDSESLNADAAPSGRQRSAVTGNPPVEGSGGGFTGEPRPEGDAGVCAEAAARKTRAKHVLAGTGDLVELAECGGGHGQTRAKATGECSARARARSALDK